MNRAGHRHQQWHARTEQQQLVVVSAPGSLRDRASTIGEGRAADPSSGSGSMAVPMMDGCESSLAGSAASLLASACPHHDDEAFPPAERHTHKACTGDVSRTDNAVEKACFHHMVQPAAGIPMRNIESRVPQGAQAAERVGGTLHGMTTFKSASQGEPKDRLPQHL